MRKLILTLFLAGTAAMPALAQDQADGRRDRGSQSTSEDDGEPTRPARARGARGQRAERAERQRPAERVRIERTERVRVERAERPAATATTDAPRRQRVVRPADDDAQRTQTRRVRRGDDSFAGRLIDMRHAQPEGTVAVHRERTPSRDGDQTSRHRDGDRTSRHRDGERRWTSHWRSDNRYDWRRHRDRNRSIFHFGRYYDPYRYGYRRFSIGFNLWPSYYSSNFWLNDPWQYRLPPAYGPYRWVRYYDDALLVNIYSGEVVDVIHSFFW